MNINELEQLDWLYYTAAMHDAYLKYASKLDAYGYYCTVEDMLDFMCMYNNISI